MPAPPHRSVAPGVTLKQLRAFVATAEHGSFTWAGQALGLSQPALTTSIRQFEETVGVVLFERTTRRVTLTSEGEEFLPTALRLIADFDFAIADLRSQARRRRETVGVSSVFSIATAILPESVMEFALDFPDVKVQLRDDHTAGVCRQVRRNEVDFGFASREVEDPELDFVHVLSDRMGLVAAREHPLSQGDGPIAWRDLEGQEFLGWGSSTGPWLALRSVEGIPETVRAPRIEMNNIPTLEAILERGRAVTAMPALAFPQNGVRGGLRYRPLVDPVATRDLFVVQRKGRILSAAAETLKARILDTVGQRAAGNALISMTA